MFHPGMQRVSVARPIPESTAVLWDHNRKLQIYTFGPHNTPDVKQFDHVFSLQINGEKLPSSKNGLNPEIRKKIQESSGFDNIFRAILREIEQKDYHKIGISCGDRVQTSVVIAENLREYYPEIQVKHLSI